MTWLSETLPASSLAVTLTTALKVLHATCLVEKEVLGHWSGRILVDQTQLS